MNRYPINIKSIFLLILMVSSFPFDLLAQSKLITTAQTALDSLQYEQAILIIEEANTATLSADEFIQAYSIQGDAFRELGEYDRAIESYLISKNKAFQTYGKIHIEVAQANNDLGLCYWRKGELTTAEDFFSEALATRIELLGEQHFKVANSYNNLGNCAFDRRDLNTARSYYEQSLRIRENILEENHLDIASNYNNLGSCYRYAGHFEEAIEYFTKSLNIRKTKLGEQHPKVAQSTNNLGQCYEQMDELEGAIDFFSQSIQIYEANEMQAHPDMATSYLGLGASYSKFGNHQSALEQFELALAIQKNTFGLESVNLITVYNNLANAHKNLGDYSQAMSFYEKNIHLLSNSRGRQHPFIAATYNNIGLIQVEQLNFEEALKNYQQALSIYETQENYHRIASTWNNIGTCLRQQKKYPAAIQAYERSGNIFEQLYGTSTIQNAAIYYNIGNCLGEEEQYGKAISKYEQAIAIQNNNSKLATYITSIGDIYQEQGRLEEALQQYEKALQLLQVEGQADGMYIQSPIETLNLLNAKANTLLKKSNSLATQSDLLEIVETVDLAITTILQRRQQIQEEYSKRKLSELAYETFDIGLAATFQLYQQTEEHQYLEKAFRYSEQSRSSLILEEQLNQKAATIAGIPDSLLEKEYQLKVSIAYYEKKKNTSKEKVESLNNILFEQKQAYLALIQQLEEDYPNYYQQKYKDEIISIDKLQEQLSPDEALIEYFVSDTTVYTFLIQAQSATLTAIVVDSLVEEVKLLREGITYYYRDFNIQSEEGYRFLLIQYLRAAHFLYQKLIEPIADNLPEYLTVINSQVLHYVPFDALVTQLPEGALHRLRDIEYLIQQYEINYASSATLLYNERSNKKRQISSKKLLAFAPTFTFPNELNLAPLSHNTKEVEQIKGFIPEAEIYIDTDASKTNFIQLASDFDVLHLATHAKADADRGDYSYLAFAAQPDTLERVLYAKDIYHLPLNASLVVLSACETGTGELLKGEGIVSLARAFIYAGAKSIVTTLWSINDATTKEVINSFYKYLNEGHSVGTALRKAKLEYIQSADDPNPFFWAAFTLTGESIHLPKNTSSLFPAIWMFIALIPLLLLLVYLFEKGTKSGN